MQDNGWNTGSIGVTSPSTPIPSPVKMLRPLSPTRSILDPPLFSMQNSVVFFVGRPFCPFNLQVWQYNKKQSHMCVYMYLKVKWLDRYKYLARTRFACLDYLQQKRMDLLLLRHNKVNVKKLLGWNNWKVSGTNTRKYSLQRFYCLCMQYLTYIFFCVCLLIYLRSTMHVLFLYSNVTIRNHN